MAVQKRETGLHRAPPDLWPQLGGQEVRGPSSEAVSAGVGDTAADFAAVSAGAADSAAVETLMAPLVPGVPKTSAMGRKMVPGQFRGSAVIEGVEAKGCTKDTRLAAAEVPGRLAAAELPGRSPAVELPGRLPGGWPRWRGLPGAASAVVHAFRRMTATISSLDPTWRAKEQQPRQMTA
jgi:hypothetical protein